MSGNSRPADGHLITFSNDAIHRHRYVRQCPKHRFEDERPERVWSLNFASFRKPNHSRVHQLRNDARILLIPNRIKPLPCQFFIVHNDA